MRLLPCVWVALVLLASTAGAAASAYNAHPKLVVVIVIDQFRADYLDPQGLATLADISSDGSAKGLPTLAC